MKYINISIEELYAALSEVKSEKVKEKEERNNIAKKYNDKMSYKDIKDTFEGLNGNKEHPHVLLRWLYNLYFYCNKKYFKNKLKAPFMGTGMGFGMGLGNSKNNSLGHWNYSNKSLFIDNAIFNSEFNVVEELLLHEMCHQAVSEIDNFDPDQKNHGMSTEEFDERYGTLINGHGTEWAKWMKHCNLPVNRFNDNTLYNYNKKIVDKRKLLYDLKNRSSDLIKNLKPNLVFDSYTPVTFILDNKTLGMGLIIYSSHKLSMIATKLNSLEYVVISNKELFMCSKSQLSEVKNNLKQWKETVNEFKYKGMNHISYNIIKSSNIKEIVAHAILEEVKNLKGAINEHVKFS